MAQFALAYSLFMVAHFVPAASGVRATAIRALGRPVYFIGYSLLSVVLLIWLVAAARGAPSPPLWSPTPALTLVPLVIMPLALILVVGGLLHSNPLSVSWRDQGFDPARPGVVAVTRHPVLVGLLLWALSHIPVNGDLVAVALFGGLTLYGAAGLAIAEQRAKRRLGRERWTALSRKTSVIPFAAMLSGRTRLNADAPTVVAVMIAVSIYLALLSGLHRWLVGVDPLSAFAI